MSHRLLFIVLTCICLGSCHSFVREPIERPSRITTTIPDVPDVPDPPKLSEYIEVYGELDGSSLYLKELKNHISFLTYYLHYTADRYKLPMVLKRDCIFNLPGEGIMLPDPPRLTRTEPPAIINRLANYIGDITKTVDDYNEELLRNYNEYKACIN